jgi:uncharacterized membrane protein
MKATNKLPKAIALFFVLLLLFQSCVVYHKTPTSLEKASQESIKAKVTTTNQQTYKYKYITYEDGQFYGVKKKSGELIKTPVSEEDTLKVVLKNKSASTWGTVSLIATPVMAFIIILIASVNSLENDYGVDIL